MVRFLERLLDWVLLWIAKHKTINPNARCPSCGACDGSIVYDISQRRVIHSCSVCSAQWPEMPRFNPELWDFNGRNLKEQAETEDKIRERFAAANKLKLAKG